MTKYKVLETSLLLLSVIILLTVLFTQWHSNFTAEIGIRLRQNRKSMAVFAINFFRKCLMLMEDSVNTFPNKNIF